MIRTVNSVRSGFLDQAHYTEGVPMHSPHSRDALNSRFAERWSVHYKVQFAYPDYAGEGMTLSVRWRIVHYYRSRNCIGR